MIFIDHVKNQYLSDFHLLQKYGILHKGILVIGDNIITPGSPDYLEFFKTN
jgi:catechol O-methyltransferase